jgi:hypothetical protein
MSGASIGYQVAASIAGFAPFLAVLLANSFGWIGPALFYVAVGLVGLAGVLATKETWGHKQRAEVDALIRGEADADRSRPRLRNRAQRDHGAASAAVRNAATICCSLARNRSVGAGTDMATT